MILTELDTNKKSSHLIRTLFANMLICSRKRVIVEKTPINNFRVRFINSIFNDAKYIYIYRNGIEVARSIEETAERIEWFGHDDYKWSQLRQYAMEQNIYPCMEGFPKDNYERGLLEWRLSNEYVREFLGELPAGRHVEISYANFVEEPRVVINKLIEFMRINRHDCVYDYLDENIGRKSSIANMDYIDDRSHAIAGPLIQING